MIASAIRSLLEKSAERVRSEGKPDIADKLLRKADAPRSGTPVVLVAGEDKRGKSSLVNALLGRTDLSPVGVEVVTGAPITFFNADPERAAIVRYGQSKPEVVEFETARQLATVQGNPQNRENIRAVRLGIPCPLLEKVTLVDTPGVGGLQSGHGELTLQSLQFAQALVFVIEAGAQFRAAELEFLRRASARIDTVILVLTKIDLHRGWRTILEDNLAILRAQAPRFADCPVVPVSSLLALRALQCDDPDDAEALLDESGIARLRKVIGDRVVERSELLDDANLLRETLWPLAVSERSIREQIGVLTSGGAARAALEAEQARLGKLGEDRAEWPRRLDTEIRKMSLQRTEDVARGLVDIRRRYETRLKQSKKEDREGLPGELVADLTALAGRLNEEAAKRLTSMLTDLLADIDPTTGMRDSIARATEQELDHQLGSIAIGSYNLDKYNKMSLLSSFSTGHGFAALASGSGLGLTAGAIIAPPIGIAIGLGLGAFYAFESFQNKKGTLFASEFRDWMSEQCNQTQLTVNTTFQREMIDVQEEMRLAVRDALAEREKDINASLAHGQRLLASEQAQQSVAKEGLEGRLTSIRSLQHEVTDLLSRLGAAKSLAELDPAVGSAAIGVPD
jgi:GTPase SAR1 family protein